MQEEIITDYDCDRLCRELKDALRNKKDSITIIWSYTKVLQK